MAIILGSLSPTSLLPSRLTTSFKIPCPLPPSPGVCFITPRLTPSIPPASTAAPFLPHPNRPKLLQFQGGKQCF
ncbi:hypothetical protein K1719_037063 [Acacia pycnantha]|nr:hypothetical protein K1719_037063 [Acacia pycnantha]